MCAVSHPDCAVSHTRIVLFQLLAVVDPDLCLLRLICEAEFAGPQAERSLEEKLVHKLFRWESVALIWILSVD